MGSLSTGFDDIVTLTSKIISDLLVKVEEFVDIFKGVLETAAEEFQNIIGAMRTGIETVVQGVQDGIRYLVDPFINDVYGIPAIARIMLQTVTSLTDGIKDVGENIKDAIGSISDAIGNL